MLEVILQAHQKDKLMTTLSTEQFEKIKDRFWVADPFDKMLYRYWHIKWIFGDEKPTYNVIQTETGIIAVKWRRPTIEEANERQRIFDNDHDLWETIMVNDYGKELKF